MSTSRQARIQRLVENANHPSVTADALEEKTPRRLPNPITGRGKQRNILSYLRDEEQPHYLLTAEKEVPEIYGPVAKPELHRSRGNKVYHLVTDRRWLVIVGNSEGNQTFEIGFGEMKATNYETDGSRLPSKLTNNRIVIETGDYQIDIPISRQFKGKDLIQLTKYLHRTAGATWKAASLNPDRAGYTYQGAERHETDPRTLEALLHEIPNSATEEADEIIATTDDADELVRKLNELIEKHQSEREEKSINDHVTDATSVEDLQERVRSPEEDRFQNAVATAEGTIEDAKRTVKESDPQRVARDALLVSQAARPIAVAAGPSTAGLMLAAAIVGGSVSAYRSTHEDSLLADLNPAELARHAEAMANAGSELEEIDGKAVGAILGASTYLSRTFAPEEYAHWVLQADPKAIMLGAEKGAQFAMERQFSRRHGTLLGAGAGLFAGYAVETSDEEQAMHDLLEEDIYEEYLEELVNRGLDLPERGV